MKEETKIATIGKDIEYLRRDVAEIREVLKSLPGGYLTIKEHNEFAEDVNKRFTLIESQSNIWKWLSPILSGIVCSGVTFLLLEYLTRIK